MRALRTLMAAQAAAAAVGVGSSGLSVGGSARRESLRHCHSKHHQQQEQQTGGSSGGGVPGEASAAAAAAALSVASSPFLASLLDPPVTVALEDATRTYSTMDVVPDCAVYDPLRPNLSSPLADTTSTTNTNTSTAAAAVGPMRAAHARGELWRHCASATDEERAANRPPRWLEALCRDLFFCTGEAAAAPAPRAAAPAPSPDEAAVDPSASLTATAAAAAAAVKRIDDGTSDYGVAPPALDPYTYLPFYLLDEADYSIGPYTFPAASQYSPHQQARLCLGAFAREYVCFCDAYAFPARHQLPTSVGTEASRLHFDPSSPSEVVYLQLSPDFPPALWLPVRGRADAVRRVLGDFATAATAHRDAHHSSFERRAAEAERVMRLQRLPSEDGGDLLRFMAYDARNALYAEAPTREFTSEQDFFLGEYHDSEELLERLDLCPFLFAIPHMRTHVDPHAEHATPTVTGPGVAPSLYRCRYSKALLLVSVQLSAEVKLPPQDPEAFQFLWRDSQVVPRMRIPVFARVVWPGEGDTTTTTTTARMSAGGLLNRRFNALFGTEFAADVPPDAVMAIFYAMHWAGRLPDLLGVRGMRRRVAELEMAVCGHPEPQRLYPGTREVPNPEYSTAERLGMHIQYLSQIGDPAATATVRQLLLRPGLPAAVRMGCAKAALIAGDRALFRQIVSQEPPGRTQLYMTKLARKRKTRDLVDPEPRLLDDQYEHAAPLWTKRGTRMDRNTLEGAVDAAGLRVAR